MIFKVHKATKYPIFKVREDDPRLPTIVQFYPSFNPSQTLEEIKEQEEGQKQEPEQKPALQNSPGIRNSEVNLSLNDEDDPNKSSLRKTVTNLFLVPRKQTFADEDLKHNAGLNGPDSADILKLDSLISPIMIPEEGDHHAT